MMFIEIYGIFSNFPESALSESVLEVGELWFDMLLHVDVHKGKLLYIGILSSKKRLVELI